ncbi:MAG: dihydropteroate synthase [Verrucomicrobiota bacterium]
MLSLSSLSQLAEQYASELAHSVQRFQIKGITHGASPQLMGVVNLSADSWYRESVCTSDEQALRRARKLWAEGAALIDIGAESTLPDAQRSPADQQLKQLLPLLTLLSDEVPLSIETYLAEVAEQCLTQGAAIINMTGNQDAESIYHSVAKAKAGVIICYVQAANVREASVIDLSEDPIGAQEAYFATEIEKARSKGVEKIWIDPGLGFYYKNLKDSAERVRYQTKVFLESFRLRKLGWPVCHALPHAFDYFGEEVRSAESFFAHAAYLGQTSLFRTHEVPKVKAVLDTIAALEP